MAMTMMLGSMVLEPPRGAEAPTSQLVGANEVDDATGRNSSVVRVERGCNPHKS